MLINAKSVAYLYAGMFYVNEKKGQIIRIYLNYLFVKQNNYDYLCQHKRHNHSGYA